MINLSSRVPNNQNRKENRMKRSSENKNPIDSKSIIQQMVDDKREIREYIKKNGSLKGFKSATIRFAKPF